MWRQLVKVRNIYRLPTGLPPCFSGVGRCVSSSQTREILSKIYVKVFELVHRAGGKRSAIFRSALWSLRTIPLVKLPKLKSTTGRG
jgi:hypothetical protein